MTSKKCHSFAGAQAGAFEMRLFIMKINFCSVSLDIAAYLTIGKFNLIDRWATLPSDPLAHSCEGNQEAESR